MQVILTKNVPKLGKRGELKRVKDGYFRNFLYPKAMAVVATPGGIRVAEGRMKKMVIEHEEMKKKAMEVKTRLEGLVITFEKKASKKGKLFGSISAQNIVDEIKKQDGIELTEAQVLLKDHLKDVGKVNVAVRIVEGVDADVKIEVKATQE
ncbi:MAG: 50S ribosomal protein L9, large subunit ribosomal protein L9 [Candidatus Peregrinibacteria bacterium GW2011_GWF2_38_29]|nr:MAG: 50S ribosomal protein L9, large subunit ribosomal protein L9 [Candidatus Peregrinibacteria bacterium GW2011_GWF2_38_29]HBB03010.1 50S ribosomal protein L9 [Candidatus Peregrinibacteria bacterium]